MPRTKDPTSLFTTLALTPTRPPPKKTHTRSYFDSTRTGAPKKPVYATVTRQYVLPVVRGFTSVIFAYGQTASGKTFTLSGSGDEPWTIPRAMKDVFEFVKSEEGREGISSSMQFFGDL
jgi:centromeric protein E